MTADATPLAAHRPMLDLDVLRSFVAIAESSSFTRAAAQVFRTPAALSMQIKRLEQTLGHPLFIREARLVRLTEEGERLLGYARRLLRLNEEAVSEFLAPTAQGQVNFASPDDIGTRVLPRVLAQFARSHPQVQVNVQVDSTIDTLKRLDQGEVDLALVTAGNAGQDRSRGEVVNTEPLVWAGRDGGLAATNRPLPVALASPGCAWREMGLAALDRSGIDYRIAYSSENCGGQEAAMLADLAVAPFPKSMVKPPLRCLDDTLPRLGDYQTLLIVRPGAGTAVSALADYIRQVFKAP
ncbi:MAG: LysR substrate-binding domain-containing protein [Saccharospirillum sp.]